MRKRVEVGGIKLQTRVVEQDSNNDRDAELNKAKRGLARMKFDKDSTKTRDGKWIWCRIDWIIAHGAVGQLVIQDKAVDKMIRGKRDENKNTGGIASIPLARWNGVCTVCGMASVVHTRPCHR